MKAMIFMTFVLLGAGCVQNSFDYNGFTITKYGNGSIFLSGKASIYFNPENLPDNLPKADYILFSYDDCDKGEAEKLSRNGTKIIGTYNCIVGIEGSTYSMKANESLGFEHGEIMINSLSIRDNSNEGNAYYLRIGSSEFYYVGNSDEIPLIRNTIDVAFLNSAGAAGILKPTIAVPVYANAEEFSKALQGSSTEVKKI